jgi:single-stranded-DNA-specific exonuclease
VFNQANARELLYNKCMENGHQDIIAQILDRRGYKDAAAIDAFLNPNYAEHLHDPYLLTDMEEAVVRIQEAVNAKENIVVYGDYDIDGITASAVMLETLLNLGHSGTSYIPDRFEEGYGINLEALKKLKADGAQLIISVDCGITSTGEVAWAMKNGLDVIITDHHAVPEEIPEAIACINPKRTGDKYPFKDLAGVGVAFKLAQALQERTGKPESGYEKWLLDLVALGTVCDVVTLVGENRVLAKYGLVVLNRTRRVGLQALAAVSGVGMGEITSYTLGYIFGPRMNAAGRLEHAARSLELMLTTNMDRAVEIANELEQLNLQRRSDQNKAFEEASVQAERYADDPVLVLAGADWSHGIVGIVASKLMERWHKPTLVMQIMGDTTKGSARSLGSFNIVEALRTMPELFIKFGGHHYAAGYTLETKNIDALRDRLNEYHGSLNLSEDVLPSVEAEVDLPNLEAVDWELLAAVSTMEPFGNGNPKPRFAGKDLRVAQMQSVGVAKNHLKLALIDRDGKIAEGIGFDLATAHPNLQAGQTVDAVFQISRNDFNGRSTIQLIVEQLS